MISSYRTMQGNLVLMKDKQLVTFYHKNRIMFLYDVIKFLITGKRGLP